MNNRQKAFCEYYAGGASAAAAARQAGYSEKTARTQGQRLLTNSDIRDYIVRLQDTFDAGRIAGMTEIRAFWTDVLRDASAKTADRLKASLLLARSSGGFFSSSTRSDDEIPPVDALSGDDIVIYVPRMLTEEECMPEDDNGQMEQPGNS